MFGVTVEAQHVWLFPACYTVYSFLYIYIIYIYWIMQQGFVRSLLSRSTSWNIPLLQLTSSQFTSFQIDIEPFFQDTRWRSLNLLMVTASLYFRHSLMSSCEYVPSFQMLERKWSLYLCAKSEWKLCLCVVNLSSLG